MSKHTPAPWNTGETIIIHANTLENLGASLGFINTSDEDRKAIAKANSHLIAAAPELLEALQDLLQNTWVDYEASVDPRPYIEKARTAISKATGVAK